MDPFRGQGPRRRVTEPSVESELDGFVRRLRALGATDDEVAATVRTWDDLDPEFTAADRAAMVRWSDARIVAELVALRAEYREHTTL